ncbi:MAG: glycoside hydrolase family 127 protein [Acidobacteriota bacterium]
MKIALTLLCSVALVQAEASTLQEVDAAHVRLLPGSPFYERQEFQRLGYLASFEPDKLLFPYRTLAKLPQPEGVTAGYDGWDSGFIRGHMAGHYLSASSRMAAATGDRSFRAKVDDMVTELAKCQDALNLDGYLAAFPMGAFGRLEGKPGDSGDVVVPYYTIHKIMAGLLDAYLNMPPIGWSRCRAGPWSFKPGMWDRPTESSSGRSTRSITSTIPCIGAAPRRTAETEDLLTDEIGGGFRIPKNPGPNRPSRLSLRLDAAVGPRLEPEVWIHRHLQAQYVRVTCFKYSSSPSPGPDTDRRAGVYRVRGIGRTERSGQSLSLL